MISNVFYEYQAIIEEFYEATAVEQTAAYLSVDAASGVSSEFIHPPCIVSVHPSNRSIVLDGSPQPFPRRADHEAVSDKRTPAVLRFCGQCQEYSFS
jgi:hypothetical protein